MLRGEHVGAESQGGGVGGIVGYRFPGGTIDARPGGSAGGELIRRELDSSEPRKLARWNGVAVADVGGRLKPCVDDAQGGVEVAWDFYRVNNGVGVLGDGGREVVTILFDGAGLVSEERGRVEAAARDVDLGEGVVELEVVPEDGGGGEEALRRTGCNSGMRRQ